MSEKTDLTLETNNSISVLENGVKEDISSGASNTVEDSYGEENSTELNVNLQELRSEFVDIVGAFNSLVEKRDIVADKVVTLKECYNELVKQNKKPVFLFCLESLFFQYKILNLEMESYQKSCSIIQNRIYGDYYKLYNTLTLQCQDNQINVDAIVNPVNSNVVLPIYKDIDPYFKYRVEDIKCVHNRILRMINLLYDVLNSKTDNIQNHRENLAVGFSLTIFLQTLEYEKALILGQINLYINYIKFYHSSQKKYLEKLIGRIDIFVAELDDFILVTNSNSDPELNMVETERPVNVNHPVIEHEGWSMVAEDVATDEDVSAIEDTPEAEEVPTEDVVAEADTPAVAAVEEDMAAVEEDVPAVEEDVPAVEEDVPAVEEDVPAVEEDVPAVEEDVPAVEEVPTEDVPPEEDIPAVEEAVVAEEDAPAAEEVPTENLVAEGDTPVEEAVVTAEEDAPAVEEAVAAEEDAPAVEEVPTENLVAEEDAPAEEEAVAATDEASPPDALEVSEGAKTVLDTESDVEGSNDSSTHNLNLDTLGNITSTNTTEGVSQYVLFCQKNPNPISLAQLPESVILEKCFTPLPNQEDYEDNEIVDIITNAIPFVSNSNASVHTATPDTIPPPQTTEDIYNTMKEKLLAKHTKPSVDTSASKYKEIPRTFTGGNVPSHPPAKKPAAATNSNKQTHPNKKTPPPPPAKSNKPPPKAANSKNIK